MECVTGCSSGGWEYRSVSDDSVQRSWALVRVALLALETRTTSWFLRSRQKMDFNRQPSVMRFWGEPNSKLSSVRVAQAEQTGFVSPMELPRRKQWKKEYPLYSCNLLSCPENSVSHSALAQISVLPAFLSRWERSGLIKESGSAVVFDKTILSIRRDTGGDVTNLSLPGYDTSFRTASEFPSSCNRKFCSRTIQTFEN